MSDLYGEILADLADRIELNEYALMVWGKSWAECSEHERAEARRLRATPFGAGFEPCVTDPTLPS